MANDYAASRATVGILLSATVPPTTTRGKPVVAVGVCSDQSPRDSGCCMVRVLALVYTYNDYYPHFLSFLSAGPCDAFTDHHHINMMRKSVHLICTLREEVHFIFLVFFVHGCWLRTFFDSSGSVASLRSFVQRAGGTTERCSSGKRLGVRQLRVRRLGTPFVVRSKYIYCISLLSSLLVIIPAGCNCIHLRSVVVFCKCCW